MATLKTRLYIHAHFNPAGMFDGFHINAGWRYEEKVTEWGLYVCVMERDLELEVPEDEAMMKSKAADVVETTMKALQAKHTARMTALLGLKNRMLALAAPDILSPGDSGRLDVLSDTDDDIPF